VAQKNFPLFAALDARTARALFGDDPTLAALAAQQRARLAAALQTCGEMASCYVEAARWSEADRRAAGSALAARCRASAERCARALAGLRAGGTMIRYHALEDPDLLAAAWRQQADSVERILQVYGLGAAPRYPQIDSLGPDPASPQFALQLRRLVQQVLDADAGQRPFFADLRQLALGLLMLDGRDEAGRYEPMESGENRAAGRRMRDIEWSRYTYSAILVPGQGPEEAGVRLSPAARERIAAAVVRYREGVAPLLIVSGGHVHPARTPYAEALEMKRALMADFGVPADAILVDPHARHTTTNLRNAARLLIRHGAPLSRPMLIVTDERQAAYIATVGFDTRTLNETGVMPYRDKQRLSATELSAVPVMDALQVGFEDALDP
jgi:hypothetical protein